MEDNKSQCMYVCNVSLCSHCHHVIFVLHVDTELLEEGDNEDEKVRVCPVQQ